MVKKFWWLGLIGLLVVAFLVGSFFFLNKAKIFHQQIKVISAVPGFKISLNDKHTLEHYLEQTGFWQKGALLYDQNQRFVPDQLVIEVTDQPQPYHQTFHPDDLTLPTFSIGWQIDEASKQYTLTAHLAQEVWQWELDRLNRYIDSQVISGILYVTKNPGELGQANAFHTDKDKQILKDLSDLDEPIFQVKQTAGCLPQLVKTAYATMWNGPDDLLCDEECQLYYGISGHLEVVSCSGNKQCGDTGNVCSCPTDGSSCIVGKECDKDEYDNPVICQCVPTGCVANGNNPACGGSSCSASCSDCTYDDRCAGVRICECDWGGATCAGVCCATEECTNPLGGDSACGSGQSCCESCDTEDPPGTITGADCGRFAI